MKNLSLVLLLTLVLVLFKSSCLQAQTNYQDVVYLKNGSIIRGVIIEQIPNVSIKIQTADRNTFVFKMDEIDKLTKEEIIQKEKTPDKDQTEKASVTVNKEIQLVDGLHFYQGTKNLSKNEVEIIIHESNNDKAYQDWKKGQSNMRTSIGLIAAGVPLTLLGLAAGIGFAVDGSEVPMTIMAVSLPIGVGILSAGIGVYVTGKKKVVNSVNSYNSSLKTASVQSKVKVTLGLSQTVPGIGIGVSF